MEKTQPVLVILEVVQVDLLVVELVMAMASLQEMLPFKGLTDQLAVEKIQQLVAHLEGPTADRLTAVH